MKMLRSTSCSINDWKSVFVFVSSRPGLTTLTQSTTFHPAETCGTSEEEFDLNFLKMLLFAGSLI